MSSLQIVTRKDNIMNTEKYVLLIILSALFLPTVDAGIELPMNGYVDVNVTPHTGALYSTAVQFNDLDVYCYTYTFNFLEFDETDLPSSIWLQIYNSSNMWSVPGIEINNSNKSRMISRKVDLAKELGVYLGDVRYRVVSNKEDPQNSELYNSTGPKIVANFRDETWTKGNEGLYNYIVSVRSSIYPLDIYLYYPKLSGKEWVYYYEYQTYRDENEGWSTISWIDAPFFKKLEFKADIL